MNAQATGGMPALQIDDVTVKFGGLTAVANLSLHAEPGMITALIGPNGAGKTTTFNACTGRGASHRPAASGSATERLDKLSTPARAAAGLGRTFQRMELFDSMSVRENVSMGPEGVLSSRRAVGPVLGAGVRAPRDRGADRGRRCSRCGLEAVANRRVRDLSTGQRRLVELARAIASPFRFLLLDEPSSGLDVHETEEFGEVLAGHVRDTGIGVLLVEHDMALVADVSSTIYVLDFGRLIWSGPTTEAMTSEVVRAAYLGGEVDPMTVEEVAAMLELRNVSAGYDTGLVLRNVSLSVPKASVVALLGANGAGKTTLLRVASGQLSPVERAGPPRRRGHDGQALGEAGPPRGVPRAGGPRHLPLAHGRGQHPAAGPARRGPAQGARAGRRGLPAPRGTARPAGRDDVRR